MFKLRSKCTLLSVQQKSEAQNIKCGDQVDMLKAHIRNADVNEF